MKLLRATPLFYLYPKAFLSSHPDVLRIDIDFWSMVHYEFEDDEWGGWKDYVSCPLDTVRTASGDCDDYAAVAASWERARGNDVELLFLYRGTLPIPEHVVAAANGRIYDSGHIWYDTTPEEYLAETAYDGYLRRKV